MEYSLDHGSMELTHPDPEETFAHTLQPSCETLPSLLLLQQQPPTYDPNPHARPRAHPATLESYQAPELMRYTQSEVEGTLDHLPRHPSEMQQTHPSQQGEPQPNYNRQVSSLPHQASPSDNNQNMAHKPSTSANSPNFPTISPPEDRWQTLEY
jgi:hypothetical protein